MHEKLYLSAGVEFCSQGHIQVYIQQRQQEGWSSSFSQQQADTLTVAYLQTNTENDNEQAILFTASWFLLTNSPVSVLVIYLFIYKTPSLPPLVSYDHDKRGILVPRKGKYFLLDH